MNYSLKAQTEEDFVKAHNKALFNEIQHFSEHAISIDNLELLTGLDFFYNLPDEIENKVEASFSLNDWPYTDDNIEEILPAE